MVLLLVVVVAGMWGAEEDGINARRGMEKRAFKGERGRGGHEKHAKKESDDTKGQRRGINRDPGLLVRDGEEFMRFKKWGGEKKRGVDV